MQKEVRMVKALIAHSGPQQNNFILSEEAIRNMHNSKNEGKPLFNRIDYNTDKLCGYLNRTELVRGDTGRLELWGYFTYTYDGTDFSKEGECSYQISYRSEDFDDERGILKDGASLINCTMVKSLD